MIDLNFDISKRDISIVNGDFSETENCSVQNGTILKEARVFDALNPVWGIGLFDTLNAPVSKVVYEMNRWSNQVTQDGGKGKFVVTNSNGVTNINITVNYP